jgi:ATP-dependent DNA helicase RecQ
MKLIYGIGDRKLQDFGQEFLDALDDYCDEPGLTRDQSMSKPRAVATASAGDSQSESQRHAEALFQKGVSVAEVVERTGKAPGTVRNYLEDYIARHKPKSVDPWVDHATYRRVLDAVRRVGMGRLKPIFFELKEKVPYDDIRIVVAQLKALQS